MNKLIHYGVCGIMAAGMMIVARLALMHADLPHYPALGLSGQEALKDIGLILGFGAAFALVWGFLVKGILPSGIFLAALVFTLVPFLTVVLGLPLWYGNRVNTEPWSLAYKALHWYLYSLGLVFFGRQSGGKD